MGMKSNYPRSWASKAFDKKCGHPFGETVHIPGLILDQVDHLLDELSLAVARVVENSTGNFRIRGFRDFSLDYRLTNTLGSSPIKESSVVEWLSYHGGQDASLAVNEISQWSLPISDWTIDFIRQIHHSTDWDITNGFDTYTFVTSGGGWTPFGIHRDYEPSLIFHLGPGIKDLWVWPDGQPDNIVFASSPALNGVSFELDRTLGSAEHFTLRPGDYICIPSNLYHVFKNSEPSAFIGIAAFVVPQNPVAHQAIDLTCAELGRDAIDILSSEEGKRRIETAARNLKSRDQSCLYTLPPHQSALSCIPSPRIPSIFTRRFPGVVQTRTDGGMYAFGQELQSRLPRDTIESLCEYVNHSESIDENTIGRLIGRGCSDSRKLLKTLHRNGAIVVA